MKLSLLIASRPVTAEISLNDIETKVYVYPSIFDRSRFRSFCIYIKLGMLLFAEGLFFFFPYCFDGNQALSTYANSSVSLNQKRIVWYKQPVDNHTGKLYGEAVGFQGFNSVNTSWFQAALHNSWGYSSVENEWNSGVGPLFLTSVGILGRAVVSLGVPVKRLTHLFSGLDAEA
ncbi:hypothetical protein V6N11_058191 [Hibiscus sabdariffa]|uniref:Uncharacterized protein n=1 Tax=Hibiscus sabdariffa TaxID=183260 RepID=A0ABR2NG21_9ROSI